MYWVNIVLIFVIKLNKNVFAKIITESVTDG